MNNLQQVLTNPTSKFHHRKHLNPIWPGGGAHCAPPVTYLRITVQIHVRAHWKNLTFPNYEFGIGHYAFYPMKLSRFAEKNIVHQKYQNFIRGDPYKPSRVATLTTLTTWPPDHLTTWTILSSLITCTRETKGTVWTTWTTLAIMNISTALTTWPPDHSTTLTSDHPDPVNCRFIRYMHIA